MEAEAKQDLWQYAPWAVAIVLGYLLWNKPVAPGPGPGPVPVLASPSKTLDACYLADRSSKLEVLKSVAAMKEATDEQRLKQFNDLSASNRVRDFQPYVDIVAVALVEDKLGELISKLQAKK
jgi:hypothetical protein